MTSQSLSPSAFSSELWSCVSTLALGQESRQPRGSPDLPRGGPGGVKEETRDEAVFLLYKYVHLFECF